MWFGWGLDYMPFNLGPLLVPGAEMTQSWHPLAEMTPNWYQPSWSEDFTIRICPAVGQNGKFCLRIRNHRVGKQTFQCHKEVVDNKWQGECTICDQYNKFWKEHHRDNDSGLGPNPVSKPKFFPGSLENFKHELIAIKPFERYYFNIIVRGNEERGVLKWACGRSIYTKIIEGIFGNESNPNVPRLGNISDSKKGHDLYIKRIMNSDRGASWPDYSGSQFLPSTPLGTPKQIKLWLSQLHDLSALRILSSEDSMSSALEDAFGYLGPFDSKTKYRSLNDPFEPSW